MVSKRNDGDWGVSAQAQQWSGRDDFDPFVSVPRSRPDCVRSRRQSCDAVALYRRERRAAIQRGLALPPSVAGLREELRRELRVAS
jgi:hypothetical protein